LPYFIPEGSILPPSCPIKIIRNPIKIRKKMEGLRPRKGTTGWKGASCMQTARLSSKSYKSSYGILEKKRAISDVYKNTRVRNQMSWPRAPLEAPLQKRTGSKEC